MKYRLSLAALVAVLVLVRPVAARAAAEDLDSVKELYAAASYEEALSRLDALSGNVDIVVANQYRALCLLGLGRAADAESALREIVTANPLYRVSPNDVSPRLVDLFADVRKRALPTAARQLYAKAKSSYDDKNHAAAVNEFKTLLQLLNDQDLQQSEARDLKDLAEGFLTLAETQVSKALAAAAPAATPSPAPAPAVPVPQAPRIFSAEDRDVRGPIEMQRTMPPWSPTSAIDQRRVFRGVLRLTIDEQGQVQAADLLTPVFPGYNDELLKAARTWRYRPAMRAGVPVKYSLTLAIVLRPQGSE
jgi:tetratricopeptide (TPR) repeat protein